MANWKYEAASPTGSLADARLDTRDAIGAVNVAANILAVTSHESFDALVGHLAVLAKADPSTFPKDRFSTADCQLFELIVACWAMRAGAQVQLEAPTGAKEEPNPDVVATADKVVIGIACKAPNSASTETYYQRMHEGAKQTLRRASDTGRIVVLNAKSRVPFDRLQPVLGKFGDPNDPPRYGAFEDPAEPARVLAREMERLNAELAALHETDVKSNPGSPMSKLDGWLFTAHAPTTIVDVALRRVDGGFARTRGPVQASAKYAGTAKLHPADAEVHRFLDRLQLEANRELVGAGGAVGLT